MAALVGVIFFCARTAVAGAAAGKLVSATGRILALDIAKSSRLLQPGEAVFEGETLRAGLGASGKFLMADQTILDLHPESELQVESFELKGGLDRNVTLNVLKGKVRASVNKSVSGTGNFRIRTHTMVMGVRGTEFVVQSASSGSQSQLTVMKGLVQVAPGAAGAATIPVEPGGQLTASAGAPPQLVKLAPDQLAAFARASTLKDPTFGSSVEITKSSGKSSGSATDSALKSAGAGASVTVSQGLSNRALTAAVAGNTSTTSSIQSSTLALSAGQTVKVNIKFSP